MKHKKINKNIIIVTGGTGGHIYPAITIGQYFIERYLNVNFITDKRGFLNSNLAKFRPKLINVRGFAGKKILQKLCFFNKIRGTILIAKEGINGTIAGLDNPVNLFQEN